MKKWSPPVDDRDHRILPRMRRQLLDHRAQLPRTGPNRSNSPAHQELGLSSQVSEVRETATAEIADRQTEANQLRHARIAAAWPANRPRSRKLKLREEQRKSGILRGQKIDYGQNVVRLAHPFVVRSIAQAHAAKVEAHDGQRKSMNRFRRLINHFVVHRPAKQRMRVADDSRKRRSVNFPHSAVASTTGSLPIWPGWAWDRQRAMKLRQSWTGFHVTTERYRGANTGRLRSLGRTIILCRTIADFPLRFSFRDARVC